MRGTPNITTSGFINIQPPAEIDIGAPPPPPLPPAIPEAPEEPPPTLITVREISIDMNTTDVYELDTAGNDVTVDAGVSIEVRGTSGEVFGAVRMTATNTRLVNNGTLTTNALEDDANDEWAYTSGTD